MVLQRPGDDLRRGGRTAVDQDHDGQAFGAVSGLGVETLRVVRTARPGGHDLAALEEEIDHLDRLFEQPARVVAEIEDQALQPSAYLGAELLHRALDPAQRLLAEGDDADIADIALGARAHRLDLDHGARDGDVEGLAVGAPYGEQYVGVGRAAHALDRLGQGEPLHRFIVEMGDQIAGSQTGAMGRCVVDRRDHLDETVLHRDLDPEPADLAAALDLHFTEVLGVEVARMRVERGQHAVDRGLDQLLVGHIRDVVRAHPFEHVAEQVEQAVGIGRVRLCLSLDRSGQEKNGRNRCEFRRSHYPPTLSLFSVSQGNGSIGRPPRRNSI